LLLDFDGVTSLRLASDGALLLATSAGELRWQRPIAYQVIGGKRRPVDCAYRVRMRHQVGFEIGSYDRSLPLTIDPTFEYSTALPDVQVHALQVDGFGQTYVAGYSPNGLTGGNDIYVSKLNNAGSSAFFTTYLGGRGDDRALGLALDYAGSIHLTGRTNSPNFPVVGATQSTLGGDFDAFLVKLTPGGDQITFSTYHGGSTYDSAAAVAINPVDNSIFIAGSTDSSDLPIRNALQSFKSSSTDGFVTRFTSSGAAQILSTYLGGTGVDSIAALKVNAAGQAWVAGASNSREVFASPNAFQRNNAGGIDCLVTGLTFDGSARAYSSYFGGSGTDMCTGLDLTAEGNVVVTGSTDSVDLPLLSPTQAALGGATDMFVAELGPTSALIFSTYLGGPRLDQANAVAVDASGTIHLVGESTGELPLLNAVSADRAGSPAALLRSPSSNSLFSQAAPGFGSETGVGVLAFQSAQVVFAGSASGRLYRSLDTGASWLPVPTALPAPIHFLAFSGPNLLAGTSQGLYFSTDQGVSWALRHAGPNLVGLAVNSTSSAFYLALSTGFYRSNDLGRTWALASSATAQTLAIDPVDPFRLYLATPTALLRSNDGGRRGPLSPRSPSPRSSPPLRLRCTASVTAACSPPRMQGSLGPLFLFPLSISWSASRSIRPTPGSSSPRRAPRGYGAPWIAD